MIVFMAVPSARKWRVLATALVLLGGSSSAVHSVARADANGGIAAAIGLTAADGSVRTQAGVRLSINAAPGAADRVYAMSGAVQARMPALRDCFAQAMLRSPLTEGRAEFELEAHSHGSARVKVTLDETHDPALVSCMKTSLSRAQLKGVQRGSRALVGLYLSNPVAALRKRMEQEPLPANAVRMLAGGRAESKGGTQAGDITFRVSGASRSAPTIAGLQRDISARLAGLLDCRRRAFRREHEAVGSVEVDLKVRAGALDHGAARSTLKRAPECVESWLGKLDTSRLADADVQLAINFSQQP